MRNFPKPSTDAPFDLRSDRSRWLYLDGAQVPIVACTRRRVVVHAFGSRYHLCRRRLERDGIDVVNGLAFSVSRYLQEEIA